MRLPAVPGPRDVLALVDRVTSLLGGAERLLSDGSEIVRDVRALLERIETTRQEASVVIGRVEETRSRASTMLAGLEGPVNQLLPVLERLGETTEPHEVDAMIELIDRLPMLAKRVEDDVLPVLGSLSTVAPDLHQLLDVSSELNEMLGKLPGMGRVRRNADSSD